MHVVEPAAPFPLPRLTPREREVLQLVADGLSNREIAEHLVVSQRTVHAHLRNAMEKTATRNRTELAVWAIRRGIAR